MVNRKKTIHPADSLKTLDKVLVADPRYQGVDIADWHSQVSEITLLDTVPIDVRQIFENAKNIALYAFFAYRLHQPAETIGYTALEKALKLKFELEKNNITLERSPRVLADYMDIALDQGWIRSERYSPFRPLASSRVQQRNIYKIIESGVMEKNQSIIIPDPEEHEVVAEMRAMKIADRVFHAGRHVRNNLAHGDGGLMPSAIGTLKKISGEINQIFSE